MFLREPRHRGGLVPVLTEVRYLPVERSRGTGTPVAFMLVAINRPVIVGRVPRKSRGRVRA